MPPAVAVITLAFDPVIRLDGFAVRVETVAVAVVVLLMLLIAARVARRVPADPSSDPRLAPGERPRGSEHLRRDDLLFVVLGAIPGAVIGARLGAVLVHLDFFAANPGAIVDPSTGSLQLSLAVVGAVLGGAIIGGLLDTPTGRWLHVAALPLLVGLGLGKAAGLGCIRDGLADRHAMGGRVCRPGPVGVAGSRDRVASIAGLRGAGCAGCAADRPGAPRGRRVQGA